MKSRLSQRQIALFLTVLMTLFIGRVLVQAIQLHFNVNWLPHFDAWHSQSIAYPLLVIFQILIIAVCIPVISNFYAERVVATRKTARICLFVGGTYFLFMITRLFVGLFFLKTHLFWSAKLPTIFHIILALFLLVISYFHYTHSGDQSNV
jgi:hypothetical protein